MSQWAHENPELASQGFDARDVYADHYDLAEAEPCRVCGEYLTKGGVTCKRCRANIEEDRMNREVG